MDNSSDTYLHGLVVSMVEVLMHSAAFWARLKQSTVLQRTIVKIHDQQQEGQILKMKTLVILKALGKEFHNEIP